MKSKTSLIVTLAILVAVIAGAGVVTMLLTNSDPVGNTPGALITGTPEQASSTDRQMAPDIEIVDRDGNTLMLSDFRGIPVVLNFWASWCPPCVGEMPEFEQAFQEYGSEVQFVMLNATDGQRETVSTATHFINDRGFTFPVFYDVFSEGVRAYNITAIPETLFIDRDGNIVANRVGTISERELRAGISQML